jgi:hypothetical protein
VRRQRVGAVVEPRVRAADDWEGLRVFDVSNPRRPKYLTAVRTDCGSHTHTVLPQRDRLLIYVQSYDIGSREYNCDSTKTPHDKISLGG